MLPTLSWSESHKPQQSPPRSTNTKEPELSPSAAHFKSLLEATKDLSPETRSFYKENNYELLWFKDNALTQLGKNAIQTLKNAHLEGLNPDDYQKAFTLDQESNLEKADILLTNEMVRFINHVRVGRVPPGSSGNIIKVKSPKTNPVELLHQIQKDPKTLDHLSPPQQPYQALKKLLAHYQELLAQDPKLPTLKDIKLKKGVTSPEVVHLRQILNFYGDLQGDTTSQEFDETLETALKKFQQRHTVESDGVVGPQTRKVLNLSLKDQVNTIILNMERWRWLPDDLGKKYIVVNVGGFEVTAVKEDHVDLRIKAIVGAPNTKTPLFYAPLENIIINPAWHVPPGIMIRQKLQKIINDPSYVYQSGMTVRDSSGTPVDPYQVDWENEGMNYHLTQAPGARNALGRIKLNIKNPYIVYLHGTPEDKLFNHAIRGFSSGCVRLQKPTELAAWVFDNEKDWSIEKINTTINAGSTKTIPLQGAIPVYFTYQTVWVDESNTVFFSQDHYHLDAPLMRLLKLSPPAASREEDENSDSL